MSFDVAWGVSTTLVWIILMVLFGAYLRRRS